MNSKPIIKGCRAIVLDSPRIRHKERVWQEVTCIQYLGDKPIYKKSGKNSLVRNAWEVRFMSDGNLMACNQDCLLRIDDPDLRKQIEHEVPIDIVLET
jgi:hypothetical protein